MTRTTTLPSASAMAGLSNCRRLATPAALWDCHQEQFAEFAAIVKMHAGIGDMVRRREDWRLLAGRGCYSDDFSLPDQAYGVVVRAPRAHALIRSVDADAARRMSGVLAVLTGAEARADGLNRIPHHANPGAAPDIVLKNRDGSVVPVAPQHVLPTDRVRYVGAAVAFVIAESVAAAKDAAEAVVVDYEPLPLKILATAAAESNAPRLYEDVPNLVIDSDVGDSAAVAAAFARAAHVTRLDRPVRGSCELFCAHDRPTALSEHAI